VRIRQEKQQLRGKLVLVGNHICKPVAPERNQRCFTFNLCLFIDLQYIVIIIKYLLLVILIIVR
jgi:hypothetical protein